MWNQLTKIMQNTSVLKVKRVDQVKRVKTITY